MQVVQPEMMGMMEMEEDEAPRLSFLRTKDNCLQICILSTVLILFHVSEVAQQIDDFVFYPLTLARTRG